MDYVENIKERLDKKRVKPAFITQPPNDGASSADEEESKTSGVLIGVNF